MAHSFGRKIARFTRARHAPALVALGAALLCAAALAAGRAAADEPILAQVTPVKLSLTARPGSPLCRDVTISNLGDGAVTVRPHLSDWTLSEEGQLSLSTAGSSAASLEGTLSFDPVEFLLPPGKSHELHLTLMLPATGAPTRWGMLLFEVRPAGDATATDGTRSPIAPPATRPADLGTTIFLSRIPIAEARASLGPVEVTPLGGDSIKVSTKLHNIGERQVNVATEFALSDSSGAKVQTAAVGGGVVLPGRARRLEWICVTPLKPGGYHASASLDLGGPDPVITEAVFRWPFGAGATPLASQPAR